MRNFLQPLDPLEKAVERLWLRSGRTRPTITVYLLKVRCYRRYCAKHGLSEIDGLTLGGSRTFARASSREHGCDRAVAIASARSALRAWSIALARLGYSVPGWKAAPKPLAVAPIIDRFAEYRCVHAGASTRTIARDVKFASRFVRFVERRHRTLEDVRLIDVDDFVRHLGRRMTAKTLSGWCSTLRVFLRYLRSAGIVQLDIASAILAPKLVTASRPPKTLSLLEVRQLLDGSDRQT